MDASRVAAIPLFADLPEAELAAVAKVAFEVEVPSGQSLTHTGGIGHALFAVEDGTADVVISGAKVATIGTGDVVGEIAVLAAPPDQFAPAEMAEGGERTASVVATSPMRMIAVYKRDVWALERQAPIATERLRAKIAEHRAADEQRQLGGKPGSPGPGTL
jgi:CRP/FNR family transcriptional regulator, cyclic AMP receptor protein